MLKITEILPNPKGTDTKNEFIEITNFADSPINIQNFSLDDSEKGSKPYKITTPTIIQPNSSIAIYNSQTKIALNNTNDSARLFDPSNTQIDELKYDKTTEGESFSYVEIISNNGKKSTFLWTDPTPGKPSKTLYKLDGKITDHSQNTFTLLENSSRKPLQISYENLQSTKELSTLTFAPSTEISILAAKRSPSTDRPPTTFDLLDYKILQTATESKTRNLQQPTTPKQTFPLPAILFPIIIILIILTLLIKRNRIKACKQL